MCFALSCKSGAEIACDLVHEVIKFNKNEWGNLSKNPIKYGNPWGDLLPCLMDYGWTDIIDQNLSIPLNE